MYKFESLKSLKIVVFLYQNRYKNVTPNLPCFDQTDPQFSIKTWQIQYIHDCFPQQKYGHFAEKTLVFEGGHNRRDTRQLKFLSTDIQQ